MTLTPLLTTLRDPQPVCEYFCRGGLIRSSTAKTLSKYPMNSPGATCFSLRAPGDWICSTLFASPMNLTCAKSTICKVSLTVND